MDDDQAYKEKVAALTLKLVEIIQKEESGDDVVIGAISGLAALTLMAMTGWDIVDAKAGLVAIVVDANSAIDFMVEARNAAEESESELKH